MATHSALAALQQPAAETPIPDDSFDLGDGLRLVVDHKLASPELPLVHRAEHLELGGRPDSKARLYQLVDGSGQVRAAWTLELYEHRARAPHFNPYGGPYIDHGLSWSAAERWLCAVDDHLIADASIDFIRFKTQPAGHDELRHTRNFALLTRLGYHVYGHELVHTRRFDERPFWWAFNRGQRKNRHRALRHGLSFHKAKPDRRAAAHEVLSQARRGCGHPLTCAAQHIEDIERRFPESQPYFVVLHQQDIVAAAVCDLRLGDFVCVRHWATLPTWSGPPPLPLLVEGLATWAQQSGFAGIDAGPSSLGGQPGAGLCRFKESLGFQACLQLEYSKVRPPSHDTWRGLAVQT